MHQPQAELIDNVSHHPTPEGLMLTLVPAGLMPRIAAWIIDFLIRMVIMFALSTPLGLFGVAGVGLLLLLYFLVTWFYPVVFEVWFNGMTPGKKNQGIYVCHDDGTPINLQSSMIRNLLRTADFLPLFFIGGVLSIMFNRKAQRLGDVVAGTMVVYQQNHTLDKVIKSVYGLMGQGDQSIFNQAEFAQASTSQTTDANQNIECDYRSPLFTFSLNLAEQQALLGLSERLFFLPLARQYEITNHLSPLVYSFNRLNVRQQPQTQDVYRAVLAKAAMLKG